MSSMEYLGPLFCDGCGGLNSETVTAGVDFSTAVVPVVADLLLFVLLLSFSPFPAITKSAFLISLRCLRRMKNQNSPNEANNTTKIGTTMAGTSVPRFDEDFEAADELADGVADVVREALEVRDASAADRRE
jgi:hypothetical protein